jgi:endonuclease VIII
MPEGPSIVILKEEVQAFKGKKVLEVGGNSKEDIKRLQGQKITDFKSWGKHFLICTKSFSIRIHFLLFGSYTINTVKSTKPRLSLVFKNGELHFYSCSVKFIEEPLDEVYDWSADIMADEWDATAAKKKLKQRPDMLACDAILSQDIFSGAGNIFKNEVLYRIKVHPASTIGAMPARKITQLVKECRNYAFDFLEWKKQYVLKKHWLAHTKKICTRCNIPLHKEYMGKTNRRTFYCDNCQVLYT